MSKLAAAINYTYTGDKRLSNKPKLNYTDVKLDVRKDPIGIETAVRIGVKYEKIVWVDEMQTESMHYVLQDLKRAMIEEVFGEFRPIILEMRAAIYDEDRTRVRKLLAELENQMFVDGV